MRTGFIFALPVMTVSAHPALKGATTTEEKFEIVSSTTSQSLLSSLPVELRGDNMTLDNFYKYFNLTLTYVGPAGTATALPPHKALRGQTDPASLVNTAKTAWDFVQDNQAVMNIDLGNYATAVPQGAKFTDFHFEHSPHIEPKGHSSDYPTGQHHFKWTGGFGNTACEIKFRNHWYAHGHKSGHDSDGFLDQVTQLVDDAHAGFSSKLEASCDTSPPTNVGKHGTVAAITMSLHMKCDSMRHDVHYIVRGDGTFQNLDPDAVVV